MGVSTYSGQAGLGQDFCFGQALCDLTEVRTAGPERLKVMSKVSAVRKHRLGLDPESVGPWGPCLQQPRREQPQGPWCGLATASHGPRCQVPRTVLPPLTYKCPLQPGSPPPQLLAGLAQDFSSSWLPLLAPFHCSFPQPHSPLKSRTINSCL